MNDIFARLIDLQKLLSRPIYLVGGAVRNEILNYPLSDIDICGALSPEQLRDELNGFFDVNEINPRIGTLKISKENLVIEYTTFRRDSYPIGGVHTPTSVEFVATPEEDAFRRDFTVNAIYKRLTDGAIIDPTGGLRDIKARVLRTTRAPQDVFAEDGLRLLRLVRFASELGFEIERDTFDEAKKKASLLADISVERVREELLKILVADTKYGVKDAHYRGLELLRELGLWQEFLPEILEGIGVTQNSIYHKFDVYYHTLHTVQASEPKLRVAALFHDIAKPLCKRRDGNMYLHSLESAEMCKQIMKRLRFSNEEIRDTSRIVRWHMFDFNGEASENKKRQFVQREWDYLEQIVSLKNADSVGTGCFAKNIYGNYLLELKNKMRAENVPIKIKDLQVNGADLIAENIEECIRGEVMRKLLESCALEDVKNDRESQLKRLRGIVKDLKNGG